MTQTNWPSTTDEIAGETSRNSSASVAPGPKTESKRKEPEGVMSLASEAVLRKGGVKLDEGCVGCREWVHSIGATAMREKEKERENMLKEKKKENMLKEKKKENMLKEKEKERENMLKRRVCVAPPPRGIHRPHLRPLAMGCVNPTVMCPPPAVYTRPRPEPDGIVLPPLRYTPAPPPSPTRDRLREADAPALPPRPARRARAAETCTGHVWSPAPPEADSPPRAARTGAPAPPHGAPPPPPPPAAPPPQGAPAAAPEAAPAPAPQIAAVPLASPAKASPASTPPRPPPPQPAAPPSQQTRPRPGAPRTGDCPDRTGDCPDRTGGGRDCAGGGRGPAAPRDCARLCRRRWQGFRRRRGFRHQVGSRAPQLLCNPRLGRRKPRQRPPPPACPPSPPPAVAARAALPLAGAAQPVPRPPAPAAVPSRARGLHPPPAPPHATGWPLGPPPRRAAPVAHGVTEAPRSGSRPAPSAARPPPAPPPLEIGAARRARDRNCIWMLARGLDRVIPPQAPPPPSRPDPHQPPPLVPPPLPLALPPGQTARRPRLARPTAQLWSCPEGWCRESCSGTDELSDQAAQALRRWS
eukprot:scaffold2887_cov76-Isochrysis_galbana.AAC.3